MGNTLTRAQFLERLSKYRGFFYLEPTEARIRLSPEFVQDRETRRRLGDLCCPGTVVLDQSRDVLPDLPYRVATDDIVDSIEDGDLMWHAADRWETATIQDSNSMHTRYVQWRRDLLAALGLEEHPAFAAKEE